MLKKQKKLKLSLEELHVQSFVTALSSEEQRKLKGGDQPTEEVPICALPTRDPIACFTVLPEYC